MCSLCYAIALRLCLHVGTCMCAVQVHAGTRVLYAVHVHAVLSYLMCM